MKNATLYFYFINFCDGVETHSYLNLFLDNHFAIYFILLLICVLHAIILKDFLCLF